MRAIATINANLAGMIGKIHASTDEMAVATGEIARGNADLSARTESQASSLQQTASSMESLTHAVQRNASDAGVANRLAANASAIAAQGGDVVSKVVGTMGAIPESSTRIGNITGVIDGTAFQTNILALRRPACRRPSAVSGCANSPRGATRPPRGTSCCRRTDPVLPAGIGRRMDCLLQRATLRPRNSSIASPISRPCVSMAKWPESTKRTSALPLSRLKASAPAGRKNGSLLPHIASVGGW